MATRSVAAAAGVSLGSICRWFPNELTAVEAIGLGHVDEVLCIFDQRTADWNTESVNAWTE
ncbi:MAG: hypothetical protein JSR91_18025 [Proteobacteria bacterium]|nr:hypothetical protein [Pseudomonadota bacterium]